MRPWAGPGGFIGAAASLLFWLAVPLVAGGQARRSMRIPHRWRYL